MAKANLTTPILLGIAYGAGNTQTRVVMGLAIGLMTVRALAVAGYHLANANRSFQRLFKELKAGKLDGFSAIPPPRFPKISLLERIIYWLIAIAIACTLLFLKADLICLEALLILTVIGSVIDFYLLIKLKVNTRRLMAVGIKLKAALASIKEGVPTPPKPVFGRALRT